MAAINGYQNGLSNALMRVSGSSSKTTYIAKSFSDAVNDVIKIDFTDSFRGNFRTAYDPTNETSGQAGFRPEMFIQPTTQKEYDIVKHFRVKQIDGLTGEVIAEGIPLRWVPPSSGEGRGGTLFIKVLYHQSEDPTAFNKNNGVIYCNEIGEFTYPLTGPEQKTYQGNPMSYGSSIRSINTLSNVYKLTALESVDSQSGTQITCSGFDPFKIGRGMYASGDRVYLKQNTQTAICTGTTGFAGTVISTAIDSNTNLMSVFVEFETTLPSTLENCSGGGATGCSRVLCTGDSAGRCGASCVIYSIQAIRKISSPDCGTVQKITFAEELSNGDYLPGQEIYQWKFEACGNHSGNGAFYIPKSSNSISKIVGEYIHWDSASKILYLLCPGSIMEQKYGNVYQKNGATLVAYGSGIASSSKFERRIGSFVNLKNTTTSPTYKPGFEYIQSWENSNGGESLYQLKSGENFYNPNYQYKPGEVVVQLLAEETLANGSKQVSNYAAGKVLSWEPNETALLSEPSTLIIKKYKKGPKDPLLFDKVSQWDNPLVPTSITTDLPNFRYGPGISPEEQGGSLMSNTQRNILPLRIVKRTSKTTNQPIDWYNFSSNGIKQPFIINDAGINLNEFSLLSTGIPVTGSSIGTTRVKALSYDGPEEVDILVPNPDFDPSNPDPEVPENIPLTIIDQVYRVHLMNSEIKPELINTLSVKDVSHICVSNTTGGSPVKEILFKVKQEETGLDDVGVTINNTKVYDTRYDLQLTTLPGTEVLEEVQTGLANKEITVQKIYELQWTGSSPTLEIDVNDTLNTIDGAEFPAQLGTSTFSFAIKQDGTPITLVPTTGTASPSDASTLNYTIFSPTGPTGDRTKIRFIRKLGSESNPITRAIFCCDVKCSINNSIIKTKKQQHFTMDVDLKYQATGKYAGKWTALLETTSAKQYEVEKLLSVFSLNGTNLFSSNVAEQFTVSKEVDDYVYKPSIIVLNEDYLEENINPATQILPAFPAFPFVLTGDETVGFSIKIRVSGVSWQIPEKPGIILRESYKDFNDSTLSVRDIPLYKSKVDGSRRHPSAFLDFRNFVNETSPDKNVGNTKFIPIPSSSIVGATVKAYLPRYDYMYIDNYGVFKFAYGKPALNPAYPQLPEEGMVIYRIKKPVYVYNYDSLSLYFTDNRRYTMKDIGRIERRVAQIESYTALSLLESKADSLLIEDENGNNRFKNGIIVDAFQTHKISDIVHPDYYAAIDDKEECLRPVAIPTNLKVTERQTGTTFIEITNNNVGVTDATGTASRGLSTGLYILPYTEKVFVTQPMATRSMSVTPFEVITLKGVIRLSPREDDWVDTTRLPDLNVDFAGNDAAWDNIVRALNDARVGPFALRYGMWRMLNSGILSTDEVRRTLNLGGNWRQDQLVTTNHWWGDQERTITQDQLRTFTQQVSLGDRVVEVGLIPYMRAKRIKIQAYALKTNARIYPFFDGIDVSQHCYIYNTPAEADADYQRPSLNPANKFTAGNGIRKTTSTGNAYIIFDMPEGTFRTGDRKFSLSDNQNNDYTRASTFAETTYSAAGLSQTRQSTNAKIRDWGMETVSWEEERRIFWDEVIVTNIGCPYRVDPLAQTFFVNKELHPNGIFLTSVDLFFQRKPDNSTNIPVEVQLRPTVNGFPDSYKIYPGGTASLHPTQVKISDNPVATDESTRTRFTFESPVYLEPGEHSIVVKSTSQEYEVYLGEIGQTLVDGSLVVTEQPYIGVFFASSNGSTWLPKPEMDLMMILHKAEFTTNTSYYFYGETTTQQQTLKYETLNFSSAYQDFTPGATVKWQISTNNGTTWTDIESGRDVHYTSTQTLNSGQKLIFKAEGITRNKDVCPIINSERLSVFTIKNIIESNSDTATNGELLPYANHIADNIDTFKRARYISRIVNLDTGFESSGFKLALAVNKPAGTKIQAFLKYQPEEQTNEFHTNPWVRLIPEMGLEEFDNFTSLSEDKYTDIKFDLPETNTLSVYNKFAIKICLYTNNEALVPKIKDLRGVAVL